MSTLFKLWTHLPKSSYTLSNLKSCQLLIILSLGQHYRPSSLFITLSLREFLPILLPSSRPACLLGLILNLVCDSPQDDRKWLLFSEGKSSNCSKVSVCSPAPHTAGAGRFQEPRNYPDGMKAEHTVNSSACLRQTQGRCTHGSVTPVPLSCLHSDHTHQTNLSFPGQLRMQVMCPSLRTLSEIFLGASLPRLISSRSCWPMDLPIQQLFRILELQLKGHLS